jgi:DNA polymerase III psi subunit
MDQSWRAAADTPIYLQAVQSIQSSALYGDLNNSFLSRRIIQMEYTVTIN